LELVRDAIMPLKTARTLLCRVGRGFLQYFQGVSKQTMTRELLDNDSVPVQKGN